MYHTNLQICNQQVRRAYRQFEHDHCMEGSEFWMLWSEGPASDQLLCMCSYFLEASATKVKFKNLWLGRSWIYNFIFLYWLYTLAWLQTQAIQICNCSLCNLLQPLSPYFSISKIWCHGKNKYPKRWHNNRLFLFYNPLCSVGPNIFKSNLFQRLSRKLVRRYFWNKPMRIHKI